MLACIDLKDIRIGKECNMTCKQRKLQKDLPECQLEMITEKHVIIQWCLLQELSECYIVKILFFSHIC